MIKVEYERSEYAIRRAIYMYYEDHNPPHFHAVYGDYKALININEGNVMKGYLPTRQIKLVLAWCEIHRDELIEDWEISKQAGKLFVIEALR